MESERERQEAERDRLAGTEKRREGVMKRVDRTKSARDDSYEGVGDWVASGCS